MRVLSPILAVFTICIPPTYARAVDAEKVPLGILYLGRQHDEKRTESFVEFLSTKFIRCTAAKREEFDAQMLQGIDVVLLDWSQQERVSSDYDCPIGHLEKWQTPTVLLGSAGLIIAGPWSVIGGAG